jgi:membrane associated rhomboid family serine protease
MFKSIIDDIRGSLSNGNMITRLIIINVIIYVVTALLFAFSHTIPFNQFITDHFALSNQWQTLLFNPWTIITHMFLHSAFFHILWNMVGLNLFGTIVGDLLGDRRILPLYLFSGFIGGVVYILATLALGQNGFALGASAAVMGLAMTAGLIAPDYSIRLLLIGDVRLKYIVFAFIFFDLLGTQSTYNAGGSFGHLGGALGGAIFIYLYKKHIDILLPIEHFINYITNLRSPVKTKQSNYRPVMKVEYRSDSISHFNKKIASDRETKQDRIDRILDKINNDGYNNLTIEEKDFLNKVSKD